MFPKYCLKTFKQYFGNMSNRKVTKLKLIHFFCPLQIFKIKYKDDFYPYLLPKSHSTADSLPFTVPGSKKAKVQVCIFTHRLKMASENYIFFQFA